MWPCWGAGHSLGTLFVFHGGNPAAFPAAGAAGAVAVLGRAGPSSAKARRTSLSSFTARELEQLRGRDLQKLCLGFGSCGLKQVKYQGFGMAGKTERHKWCLMLGFNLFKQGAVVHD